jgi:hypothetical protein
MSSSRFKKFAKNGAKYFLIAYFFLFVGIPAITLAATDAYVPLAPIGDFVNTTTAADLSQYLNNMFRLGIGIATALAVLMIVIGGIEYMSTDAIGGKEEGKEKITSALWGLFLALAAYLILNTINPQLLNTSLDINNGSSIPGSVTGSNQGAIAAQTYTDSDGIVYTDYSNGYTSITLQDGTIYFLDPNDNLVNGPCDGCVYHY